MWTTSNYNWTLKYTINGYFSIVQWDIVNGGDLHILFTDTGIYRRYSFGWITNVSSNSTIAVIDRSIYIIIILITIFLDTIRVTPFEHVIIPPPMAKIYLKLNHYVNEVVWSLDTRQLVCLLHNNDIIVCKLYYKLL